MAGAAIGGIIGGGIQFGPMILDGIKQVPGFIEAFSSASIPLFPPSGGLALAGGGVIGGPSGIAVSGQQIINGVVAGTATILANLMLSSSMSQGDSRAKDGPNSKGTNQDIDLRDIDPDNLPDGWTKTEHNGFTHIRDTNGNIRIRIDPPDNVTSYPHKHFYDANGSSLDIHGNIVSPKSPDAHIPLN